ncbi:MAG: N-acetylmuramoyl-L-alanine amidase, partial [Anaerolineaceae bacterium]
MCLIWGEQAMATIILDAGHGGNDLGDAYGFRYEKNDNLRLTLALGEELEILGYNVVYIRTNDIYVADNDRVQIANRAGGDLLLSIHRIIGEIVVSDSGLAFFVSELGGVAEEAAINIAEELRPLGFENYSIEVRTERLLIRDSDMPALLMGIGHLNSDYDNLQFDTCLQNIAEAIARGISETIPLNSDQSDIINKKIKHISTVEKSVSKEKYLVQIGLFADYSIAVHMHNELLN